jgi:hypothetical protein
MNHIINKYIALIANTSLMPTDNGTAANNYSYPLIA